MDFIGPFLQYSKSTYHYVYPTIIIMVKQCAYLTLPYLDTIVFSTVLMYTYFVAG